MGQKIRRSPLSPLCGAALVIMSGKRFSDRNNDIIPPSREFVNRDCTAPPAESAGQGIVFLKSGAIRAFRRRTCGMLCVKYAQRSDCHGFPENRLRDHPHGPGRGAADSGNHEKVGGRMPSGTATARTSRRRCGALPPKSTPPTTPPGRTTPGPWPIPGRFSSAIS